MAALLLPVSMCLYVPIFRFFKFVIIFAVVLVTVLLLYTSSSYISLLKRQVFIGQETCSNYFGKQYTEKLLVCSKPHIGESVMCEKNPVSKMMAKCTIHGFVLEKFPMTRAQPKLRTDVIKVRQLENERRNCQSPSLSQLYGSTEETDHVRQLVKKVLQKKPLRASGCRVRLKETVYLFGGDHHIYFRFLGWYNLFKTIYYDRSKTYRIIRFTEDHDFANVEKRLFPAVISLSNLTSFPVCIEKAVLVPRSFASTPFRCKMELLGFCSDCLSLGFDEPTFLKFREAMLKACSIDTRVNEGLKARNMLIILRKPYKRYSGDVGNFERVMTNEVELLRALRSNFTMFNIVPVHMEDLTLCEQINVSAAANVFMGVHGAGMSHLWWTPKGATILEFMPDYKSGKPSFEVLSQLIRANYIKLRVAGEQKITVDVDEVIDILKRSVTSRVHNRKVT